MKEILLELKNIHKEFKNGDGSKTNAVKGVDLIVFKGECVAIVGGSGSGKSTLARLISHFTPVTDGVLLLEGIDVTHLDRKDRKGYYEKVQMVFQNPLDTFSPRMRIGTYMMEPFLNFGLYSRSEAKAYVEELLEKVGLEQKHMEMYPDQLSGGQLQRVVIARAIGLKPELLILDEATSALDVTIQKDVLGLLKKLALENVYSSLFITHDLALAEQMANRVYVMKDGSVVEILESDNLLEEAAHPYTKELLNAVF